MFERRRKKGKQADKPTDDEDQLLRKLWETYTTFTHGAMDKAQFLDGLIALGQEPDDLEETFRQANSSGTGALSYEEMMAEARRRINDPELMKEYYRKQKPPGH